MVDIKKIFTTTEAGLRNSFTSLKEDASVEEINALHLKCTDAVKTMKSVVKKQRIPSGPKAAIETLMNKVSEIAFRLKWRLASREKQSEDLLKVVEIESLFNNRLRTGIIVNVNFIDVANFLDECRNAVTEYVSNAVQDFKCVKASVTLTSGFVHNEKDAEKCFPVKYRELCVSSDLNMWFEDYVKDVLLTDIEDFEACESGWVLTQIKNLVIRIAKYNPLRAGSWIDLPKWLKSRKAIVNVKNTSDDCFALAVMSALFPTDRNSDRPSSYPSYEEHLKFINIPFPVALKDVVKFEAQNDISVNVFIIENSEILPVHVTKCEKSNHVNLLMLTKDSEDESYYHYCWIKNLSRALSIQVSANNGAKHFCNRCLHYFHSEEKLSEHKIDCGNMNECKITLPEPGENIMKFKNHRRSLPIPYVIYFDTETLLKKVTSETAPKTAYQQHEIYAAGYYIHCNFDKSQCKYREMSGSGCDDWFARELTQIGNNISEVIIL